MHASTDDGSRAALVRHEQRARAMGTEFRISLYARSAEQARAAMNAAFARIAQLDDALSDYDPKSELSRLSRASDDACPTPWTPVSEELFAVLAQAQALAALSRGAFDATVGPYSRLWRRARRQDRAPTNDELAAVARSVGYRHVELDAPLRAVRLLAPSMRLDLGGIAKGYAVDQALLVLRAHGIERALVDGGGDLAVGAPPPGREAWRVSLADFAPGHSESVSLVRGAVATSGDLERFVEIEGVRHSHLIDPRTGRALVTRRLVSVIAPSCVEADALASALSVTGPEERDALMRAVHSASPSIAVRVVTLVGDDRRVWRVRW